MTPKEPDPAQWPDDFPDETDWQMPPTGGISADFVDRTWLRVQAELGDRFGGDLDSTLDSTDPDSIDLPADLIAAYTVPPPSADFVEVAMSHIRREASPTWRGFLAKYAVPQPSADFVDRVLASLRRPSTEPLHRVYPLRRVATRSVWLAAAAAVLLTLGVIALRQPTDDSLPFEVLSAESFSPDPWGAALSAGNGRVLRVGHDDAALRLAALVGVGRGD